MSVPNHLTTDTLGKTGKELWRSYLRGMPEEWEIDESDALILRMACSQADDLARLEAAIRDHGVIVTGSRGQPVVSAAVAEARQARQAIPKLLAQIPYPEKDGGNTAVTRKARHAANVRWSK